MKLRVFTLLFSLLICFPARAETALYPLQIISKEVEHAFQVELAVTKETRARGLMFRKELPEDGGMLFIYDAPRIPAMWMKNTLIPLDMVFIDEAREIVHIHPMAKPESLETIGWSSPVWAVLELPGGTAEKLKLEAGDDVKFNP